MRIDRQTSRRLEPSVERFEDRALLTLIFVLNGNSFRAAKPSSLTGNAAAVLERAGEKVVQIANPAITGASFASLARSIVKAARGQTIGLVGFSAGGAIALRLAETPGLKVAAVLDYYGVPDVQAYLARQGVGGDVNPILGLAPFKGSVVSIFSGPIATHATVVAAFGLEDPHVRAAASGADLLRDDPAAHVYDYAGGHGVGITASVPALEAFIASV